MTIPQLTVKLGEVLNADLFRRHDEDIRNFWSSITFRSILAA
jgi:hypothetical protein